MNGLFHSNSVFTAQKRMCELAEEINETLAQFHPLFDPFHIFEPQIKLIHRGVSTLIPVTDAPLLYMIQQGLRATEEAWENPPQTSGAAMDEVGRVLIAMEIWINLRNGRRVLHEHSDLFLQFDQASSYILGMHHGRFLPAYMDAINGTIPNPSPQQQGATDEQIAGLPVHVATAEHTDQECAICLETFAAGRGITTLPCCHQFHSDCIESWLKQCATCPADRSIVFSD